MSTFGRDEGGEIRGDRRRGHYWDCGSTVFEMRRAFLTDSGGPKRRFGDLGGSTGDVKMGGISCTPEEERKGYHF